ncbi:DUF397 domain-containing protein [Streptomyces sp. NPDC053048]|uniref:DUF397 domain-containing protein n=1 Tax=Streptomyces sp. NPDC053048 TaxID=3365694 RepID=UPI0037D822CF
MHSERPIPEWRKSSYSGAGDDDGGDNCLEALAAWHKSSYSDVGDDQGGDNCLEINDLSLTHIRIRDSKHPQGPILTLPSSSWATLLTALR